MPRNVPHYQVMPDLSAEEYEALKADIAANGIRVPQVSDEPMYGQSTGDCPG